MIHSSTVKLLVIIYIFSSELVKAECKKKISCEYFLLNC